MGPVKIKLKLYCENGYQLAKLLRQNHLGSVGCVMLVCCILIALFCSQISPFDPTEPTMEFMEGPSSLHPLGTDQMGRDLLSRVLHGTKISMLVGVASALIAVVIGTAIGLLSGYFGGRLGEGLMRFTDMFLVLPYLPLMIILTAIIGQNQMILIVVIGITSWPSMSRIIRSEVLSIRQRAYVERARAIGAGHTHIIFKHIMPNVLPLISANVVLIIPVAIISESTLSFIGLGDPTTISWGSILNDALNNNAIMLGQWWFYLPAGLAIVFLSLGFSFIGHALDEIANPKLRKES
ncbi:ABC transporter permease [bacterium]|nr:ABC transporter permease [bacterium]